MSEALNSFEPDPERNVNAEFYLWQKPHHASDYGKVE